MRMESVSRTWFYDFVFGFEFIVRERERERLSHISEWQQFQLPVLCFYPVVMGMVMVPPAAWFFGLFIRVFLL